MGDQAEMWAEVKRRRKARRLKPFGVRCPVCEANLPKAHPTILLPNQRCNVCGFTDPRPRSVMHQK